MNIQVMEFLSDLQERARTGEVESLVFVALLDDGSADYGYTDLDEESCEKAHVALFELVADLQPQLDS